MSLRLPSGKRCPVLPRPLCAGLVSTQGRWSLDAVGNGVQHTVSPPKATNTGLPRDSHQVQERDARSRLKPQAQAQLSPRCWTRHGITEWILPEQSAIAVGPTDHEEDAAGLVLSGLPTHQAVVLGLSASAPRSGWALGREAASWRRWRLSNRLGTNRTPDGGPGCSQQKKPVPRR